MAYLAYNEQMKIRATWLNTISAGMMLVGFLTPLAASLNPSSLLSTDDVLGRLAELRTAVLFGIWLLAAFALHLMAIRTAGRIKE